MKSFAFIITIIIVIIMMVIAAIMAIRGEEKQQLQFKSSPSTSSRTNTSDVGRSLSARDRRPDLKVQRD